MKNKLLELRLFLKQQGIIPLTYAKYALVDADDYDNLNKYRWCYSKTSGGYATRRDAETDKIVLMHRQIMNTPVGWDTDHIDRNTLDNRKGNLRICNRSQNNGNRMINKNKKFTLFKGVFWRKDRSVWKAQIGRDKKHKHLGYFSCEIEAAKAYNKAAVEYFGEFAKLNVF